MRNKLLVGFLLVCSASYASTSQVSTSADRWVDSVFNKMSRKEKIGQLMIIRAHSNRGEGHIDSVTEAIKRYKVGGLCFFQGGPVRQALLTNYYRSFSKYPLLVAMDAEWGLGMRLDSVKNLPRQLMLGATQDGELVYDYGKAIAAQCKRVGVNEDFAPVVDVNNNPANPVINDRSFGEDKYKVALYGIKYMKGLQDNGVLASAKHFPGHGDVSVDSHLDLPVINKTTAQLDSLELYPFKALINEGAASVMVAHLYIPAIDSSANRATSLSYKNVTGLLKNEMKYKGLSITDGLEMKGVTKFFPAGEVSLEAIKAGNDMLLLPEDLKGSVKKIRKALRKNEIDKADFDNRVKKVLQAKYFAGLNNTTVIDTTNLVNDLNANTAKLTRRIAEAAITLVKLQNKKLLPLVKGGRVAYVGVGIDKPNAFASGLQQAFGADAYFYSYKQDSVSALNLFKNIKGKYDYVVIGVHNYSRRPANKFGISNAAYNLIHQLQSQTTAISFMFGNPYAIKNIESTGNNIVACYEDDEVTQLTAVDVLLGIVSPKGTLPVTVSDNLKYGTGLVESRSFPHEAPENVGLSSEVLNQIDGVVQDAIVKKATPGCVVLVAKDGKVAFHKAYGYTYIDSAQPVTLDKIYDLASVTKIAATTLAIMKLYEEGKIDLTKDLGYYLPLVRNTDKEYLPLTNILLHQAGLEGWIPFYEATLDKEGFPKTSIYRYYKDDTFSIQVAEGIFMRKDYVDTMYSKILKSKLGPQNHYEYSDNDFIFLGKVVESITGQPLEDYVKETFYKPMQLTSTTFRPKEHFPKDAIVPTAVENGFRQQVLRGDVHDPAAAMFGGVAGHAGLFSNAYDLGKLFQMLLNGGEMDGNRYLQAKTIEKFTAYGSNVSRRGLGFDKPEKDNASRATPYPDRYASPATFGHTGFTGTCVWADPQYNLLYIFLSNRVAYDKGDNNKLLKMKVRSNIQDIIYKAMNKADLNTAKINQ